MTNQKGGRAFISFNEVARRQRSEVAADRLTRKEAAAAVDAMQARKDKPGERVYKPAKPPPGRPPLRSRAAERDAAQYNAKAYGPELPFFAPYNPQQQ